MNDSRLEASWIGTTPDETYGECPDCGKHLDEDDFWNGECRYCGREVEEE